LTGRVAKRTPEPLRSRRGRRAGYGSLRLPADLVFVDVGVKPRVELAEGGHPPDRRRCRVASTSRQRSLYAAGNCPSAFTS
jgi:hypothetical protein